MPSYVHGTPVIEPHVGADRFRAQPVLSLVLSNLPPNASSKTCNAPGAPVWQRNYYEHVTRNEEGLNAIRTYIQHNPANWATDAENVWHARKHALNSL